MNAIKLIILGGGNSTLEILDIIEDINKKKNQKINVVGILDDRNEIKKKILKIPVIGKIKEIKKFKKENFFLSISSYKNRFLREKIIYKTRKFHKRFINIIHPNSLISGNSKIGLNCLINKNTSIYAGSKIGNFCTIQSDVSIAPKSNIDDNSFIGKSVIVASNSKVGKNCYLGFNSSILENVTLSSGTRALPYSVINKTLKRKNSVVFGYPAKLISYDK